MVDVSPLVSCLTRQLKHVVYNGCDALAMPCAGGSKRSMNALFVTGSVLLLSLTAPPMNAIRLFL